jgi:hypothetical protein
MGKAQLLAFTQQGICQSQRWRFVIHRRIERNASASVEYMTQGRGQGTKGKAMRHRIEICDKIAADAACLQAKSGFVVQVSSPWKQKNVSDG